MDSSYRVPPTSSLTGLSRPGLEALWVALFSKVAMLKQVVVEPREAIARLKAAVPEGSQLKGYET